jgi:hypothetical protein
MSYNRIDRAVQNADRDCGVRAAWMWTNCALRQNVKDFTAGLFAFSNDDPAGTAYGPYHQNAKEDQS